MSEAPAKSAVPIRAQCPGETSAEFMERYHREVETPQARACHEELARMDRGVGPQPDVVQLAEWLRDRQPLKDPDA